MLCGFGLVAGIPLGLILEPKYAFLFFAITDATLALILYFLVSIACIRFFWMKRREQFSVVKHGIVPVLGMIITGGILVALVTPPPPGVQGFGPIVAGIWLLAGVGVMLGLKFNT